MFLEATVKHENIRSRTCRRVQFITHSECYACRTRKHPRLHIASPANRHIEIGFGRRHGDGSCVIGGIKRQICTSDVISLWKAICLPILLHVSIFLISVTKLWDKIIWLYMCKGRKHLAKVLESKTGCTMANMFDFYLLITVKSDSKSNISDEIYQHNLSEWCHTSHSRSCQCSRRFCRNDDRDAAFIHASNCITLRTDLVDMVEIFKTAYGTSWKSKRTSCKRNNEEVKLYLPKTSEMIYMASIAGRKCRNVIGPHHPSLR